jgi:hypothetical protein
VVVVVVVVVDADGAVVDVIRGTTRPFCALVRGWAVGTHSRR